MSILSLQGVTKRYPTDGTIVTALREISLELNSGQFAAVVGRSGCGKSTLLNLSGAMDFPTSGTVRIGSVVTSQLGDAALTKLRRREIGFIFQFFQLLPTLTAAENVELPLLLDGRNHVRARALERLSWVGLEHLAHRLPHQLSGGEAQRVAIARALVHSPKLLLADEPIGNLDSSTGNSVVDLLRRIATELRATVLMATHSIESTMKCDCIIRLRDGCIEGIERR